MSAPPFEPHLAWAKGGHARVVAMNGDAVTLRSTTPAPPGARLDATLVGGATTAVKIKSHGSRKEPDGTFTLPGRLLDLSKELREQLRALASP